MTEDEAIERIAQAMADDRNETEGYIPDHRNAYQAVQFRPEAQIAWNEMKAIARETPRDPVPAWRNDLSIEKARDLMIAGMKREGQNTVPNPAWLNDSGNGRL